MCISVGGLRAWGASIIGALVVGTRLFRHAVEMQGAF